MVKDAKEKRPEVAEDTKPLNETALREEAEAEAKAELEKELSEQAEANAAAEGTLLKERMKELAKAKYRNEVREKLEAEYRAKQEAELRAIAEEEAKAEAEAEEKAHLKKVTSNEWKKQPKAEMRRVFRCENPPAKESYMVLMERKRIIDGTEQDALSVSVSANSAQQYILPDGAIEYEKQLKAFRKLEDQGLIKEVPPSQEGVPYIPEKQKKLQELKAQLKALEASM